MLCPDSHNKEHGAKNMSSTSSLTLAGVGRRQTSFQLHFGRQRGSCAHVPLLSASVALRPAALLGNN